MRLKTFNSYNESWYSVAAQMLNSMPDKDKTLDFSKPSTNDFSVRSAKVFYPDGAIIEYSISIENVYSDSETYRLVEPTNRNPNDYFHKALMYYSLLGDSLQFENFEEYTLVRGYLNEEDLNTHTFNGYVFNDNGFYEVGIRLSTKPCSFMANTPLNYELIRILSTYKDTFHYMRKNVSVGKRFLYKVKDYLLDDNEPTIQSEVGGIPIVIVLYCNIVFNWDYRQVDICKQILNYMRLSNFKVDAVTTNNPSDLGELFYV